MRHAVAAALVVAFLALARWQLERAAGGNMLSYAYAVEWPVFAGFVVFVWYKEVQRARAEAADRSAGTGDTPAPAPRRPGELPPVRSSRRARVGPGYDDTGDEQLAAYNRYLAWLKDNPDARPADYREE